MTDAVVVGGGIAGLSAALALADAGLRVVVLERAPRVGGRASSWRHGPSGDVVDIGPHVLTTAYRNLPALMKRVGTGHLVQWEDDTLLTFGNTRPVTRLRHAPLTPPLSLLPSFTRLPGIGVRDLASNMAPTWQALVYGEDELPRLDPIPALDYLRSRGVTERMIDAFWRFASMAVMNVPLERCSTAALMRVHSLFMGQRRMRFGFPAVPLGDLFAEPAACAIAERGGEVRLNTTVVQVRHNEREHVAVLEGGEQVAARHLVLALPPDALAAVRPGLARTEAFVPSPYVSVYAWFDRRLTREPFWALQWSPRRMNYDFYDLANIRRDGPATSLIASNIIHSHRTRGLGDEAIVRGTVEEIAEFLPDARRARLLHADVHHIPMAICEPAPGTESCRPSTRTGVPGLVLAGDWVRTRFPSSMESAARAGLLAAEAVLEDRGAPRRLAQEPPANDGLAGVIQRAAQWLRRRPRHLQGRAGTPQAPGEAA